NPLAPDRSRVVRCGPQGSDAVPTTRRCQQARRFRYVGGLPPPAGDRSLSLLFISASAPSPSTRSILNDMHPILSVLAPERIATNASTDAAAAVTRLKQIYERNTRFLRNRFEAFAKGETPARRVRATYPFVRIT